MSAPQKPMAAPHYPNSQNRSSGRENYQQLASPGDVSNDEKKSRRWPGRFRNESLVPVPTGKVLPPPKPAFENIGQRTIRQLDDPGIDVTLSEHKHCILNPKVETPKPWRSELEAIFESLPSREFQQGYIDYYTLGYTGEQMPRVAPPRRYEQAYLFGVLERRWDIDVEYGIYRQCMGISDEGEINGARQFAEVGTESSMASD
ncbi:hypothetical protein ABW20_dc0101469 [Dactylellina cionopaga]|nr:hypothetical protein ABW20_dc0101469 [Dactylellina cionopaga]